MTRIAAFDRGSTDHPANPDSLAETYGLADIRDAAALAKLPAEKQKAFTH